MASSRPPVSPQMERQRPKRVSRLVEMFESSSPSSPPTQSLLTPSTSSPPSSSSVSSPPPSSSPLSLTITNIPSPASPASPASPTSFTSLASNLSAKLLTPVGFKKFGGFSSGNRREVSEKIANNNNDSNNFDSEIRLSSALIDKGNKNDKFEKQKDKARTKATEEIGKSSDVVTFESEYDASSLQLNPDSVKRLLEKFDSDHEDAIPAERKDGVRNVISNNRTEDYVNIESVVVGSTSQSFTTETINLKTVAEAQENRRRESDGEVKKTQQVHHSVLRYPAVDYTTWSSKMSKSSEHAKPSKPAKPPRLLALPLDSDNATSAAGTSHSESSIVISLVATVSSSSTGVDHVPKFTSSTPVKLPSPRSPEAPKSPNSSVLPTKGPESNSSASPDSIPMRPPRPKSRPSKSAVLEVASVVVDPPPPHESDVATKRAEVSRTSSVDRFDERRDSAPTYERWRRQAVKKPVQNRSSLPSTGTDDRESSGDGGASENISDDAKESKNLENVSYDYGHRKSLEAPRLLHRRNSRSLPGTDDEGEGSSDIQRPRRKSNALANMFRRRSSSSEPRGLSPPPLPSRRSSGGVAAQLLKKAREYVANGGDAGDAEKAPEINADKEVHNGEAPKASPAPSVMSNLSPGKDRIKRRHSRFGNEPYYQVYPLPYQSREADISENGPSNSDKLSVDSDDSKLTNCASEELLCDKNDEGGNFAVNGDDAGSSLTVSLKRSNSERDTKASVRKPNSRKRDRGRRRRTTMDLLNPNSNARTLWAQTHEVLESGLLQRLSSEDVRHQEAMFEIITSEASFLRSLDTLVSVFANAPELSGRLDEESVVSRRERTCIFSNIEGVRDASDKFLEALEKRWEENPLISDVCDIILQLVESYFKGAYIPYCRNQSYQERTLQELIKRPDFCQVLENLQQHKQCQFLTLSSFLLLPMQRVTRLPLLVEAVLKHREGGTDGWLKANDALNSLKALTRECNEAAKTMERVEAMVRLDTRIKFPANIKSLPIVKESRHVVREGTVTKFDENGRRTVSGRLREKAIHLILFTDFLFVTKKSRERRPFGPTEGEHDDDVRYNVLDYCARHSVECFSLAEEENSPAKSGSPTKHENMGRIVLLKNHEDKIAEYFISCESSSEMERWKSALAPKQEGDEGEEIYAAWASPRYAVKRSHAAEQEDELTLHVGEVVEVSKKMKDGWYQGVRISDNALGWFPAHCVEELDGSEFKQAKNLRQKYQLIKAAEQIWKKSKA